mgnify:CR=1 FL=1
MFVNEEFLQFIWKFQLFNFSNLKCTNKEELLILSPGTHNHNSGPDFLNTRLRLGGMLWSGDVEVHFKSSDWYLHNHEENSHFNAVILHVVYEEDVVVFLEGSSLPCLELKELIPEEYLNGYEALYYSKAEIPCSYAIGGLNKFFWNSYAERLLVERLEIKQAHVRDVFLATKQNYQECFYRMIAYSLGLSINADSMFRLAEVTPFRMLQKHRISRFQIEALLYGQSGLLERRFSDDYPKELQKEYVFYKEKYGLEPIEYQQWKFFRLRPNSFPTLRISYLADFVFKSESMFDLLFQFKHVDEILPFFNLNLSEYWKSHYVFDKKSKKRNNRLGSFTVNIILINAILPFCFFYAKQHSDELMMQRVLDAFMHLKYENNKVVNYFKTAGVPVKSAAMSQALIHLHQNYCIPRNCLNCRVLNQILK